MAGPRLRPSARGALVLAVWNEERLSEVVRRGLPDPRESRNRRPGKPAPAVKFRKQTPCPLPAGTSNLLRPLHRIDQLVVGQTTEIIRRSIVRSRSYPHISSRPLAPFGFRKTDGMYNEQRATGSVFNVHVTRPDDIGAVEIVFADQQRACDYAADRSRDHRVSSALVTRFVVGQLGRAIPWPGTSTASSSHNGSTGSSIPWTATTTVRPRLVPARREANLASTADRATSVKNGTGARSSLSWRADCGAGGVDQSRIDLDRPGLLDHGGRTA